MKKVYISGPFRGKTPWDIAENVRRAERAALKSWREGNATFCPHTNTQHFQDSVPDDHFLIGDLALLEDYDEIWMVEGWEDSEGSKIELCRALELEIKPREAFPIDDGCIICVDLGQFCAKLVAKYQDWLDRYLPKREIKCALNWNEA